MARVSQWEECRTATHRNKVKSLNDFKKSMLDFPCSFHLVLPNLSPDLTASSKPHVLTEPYMSKQNCRRLRDELRDEDDDEDFEEVIWKENFLTRILFELDGDVADAMKLNQRIIRCEANSNNLTALANSAFLHFHNQDIKKAMDVLNKLRDLRKDGKVFKDLKVQALIEQAYAFRKLGGSSNLLCTIQLLTTVTKFVPANEKVRFMLALVNRRCTSLMLYTENADRIDRKKHALEAANLLHELGNTAKDKSIRAAAIAELAFLRKGDIIKELRLVETPVWVELIGLQSWKQLCYRALSVDEENTNDRVLKMVGQMFKSDKKVWEEAIVLLQKSIQIRPSSRAHHHLGLLFVKKSVAYEKEKKKLEQKRGIQFSSEMSEKYIRRDTFKNLQERLSYNIKVPRQKLPPFSDDNPFIEKAEFNLKKSAEISYNISITAQYDFALFLARRCKYDEARNICQKAIDIFSESPFSFIKRLHLVNVYNLYGMCCSLEAEETKDVETKKILLKQNEDYLWLAIKMATEIAASVPELKECATDLWKIFDQLIHAFQSRGDAHSQLKLCDFVKNYSFPVKIEEILSIEIPAWKRKECLEMYLKKYMNEKDFESADFLLKLVKLHPESCQLTMLNSEIVKMLRFEQAAITLEKNNQKSKSFPDPIWKAIFDEFMYAKKTNPQSEHSMNFDVLFIADNCLGDEDEIWSYRASECLSRVLNRTCGLTVDNVERVKVPGELNLEQETRAIQNTKILVFLLDRPVDVNSLSRNDDDDYLETNLDQTIDKLDRLTVTSQSFANRDGGRTPLRTSPQKILDIKDELVKGVTDEPPSCSSRFKYLITLALESHLDHSAPRQVIMAVESDSDKELVPHEARGLPILVMSDEDIAIIEDPECKDAMKQNELIMNMFELLVRTDKTTPSNSSMHAH